MNSNSVDLQGADVIAPSGEAASVVAAAEGELESLRRKLEAADAAVAAARDQQLRSAAEMENIRRRAARDIESAQRFALEKFAGDLLGVRDSLELAVQSGAAADASALRAGQAATLQLLAQAFERHAIKPIQPQGQPFDPGQHEAMLTQPSSEWPPGSVLQVLQNGYQLNGRLLRPARVIVSAAPPESPPGDPNAQVSA